MALRLPKWRYEITPYQDNWYQKNKERLLVSRKLWYREQGKEKYESRKSLFDFIKTTLGCIDCGYSENPVALDFDHRDKKNFNIPQSWNSSLEKLISEILLCDIRCANCHRIKHLGG